MSRLTVEASLILGPGEIFVGGADGTAQKLAAAPTDTGYTLVRHNGVFRWVPAADPGAITATYWLDPALDRRITLTAINTTGATLHDHPLTVVLPTSVSPTAATLRAVEVTSDGLIDRAYGWRYYQTQSNSLNRLPLLPVALSGQTVTVKTLGAWAAGETRRFTLYWDSTGAATVPALNYLSTTLTADRWTAKRIGPDTEDTAVNPASTYIDMALSTTGLPAQAAGRLAIGHLDFNQLVRLFVYKVNGDAGTYGLTAGTATVTDDGPTVTVTGTVQSGARGAAHDWDGTYTAVYGHRLCRLGKADGTQPGDLPKSLDVVTLTMNLTCAQAYTPPADAGDGTSLLSTALFSLNSSGETWSGNTTTPVADQLSAWYIANGAPVAIAANEDTMALPVVGTIMGSAGNVNCYAVRVDAASLNLGANQTGAHLKWYGRNLQIANQVSTGTIPVGATISLTITYAHHAVSAATTAGANMLPRELAAIMPTLGATVQTGVGTVETYRAAALPLTATLAAESAVAGVKYFQDNAVAKTGIAGNYAYQVALKAGTVDVPDDDDGNYGQAHALHGLCLRYLRTHDATLIPLIKNQVNWHVQIERDAVAQYGAWWAGSAPYWYCPMGTTITKAADGGVYGGDVDPAFGATAAPITYTGGQVRRATSIDQMHMVAHGLYAYLYLLRTEPAITGTSTYADVTALLGRMVTFEAAHMPATNCICANLLARVNGTTPANGNGITAAYLNAASLTALANPYQGSDYQPWQVANGDNIVIGPSSNVSIDDFFRAVFAPNSERAGVVNYLTGRALDMLAADLSRHDVVAGTASWGVIGPYPAGWLPRANATGNNYRYQAGRTGDDHYLSLTAGGVRDSMSGRMAQRAVVLALLALHAPTTTLQTNIDTGATVNVCDALDQVIRAGALYGTEPTTQARSFSAPGYLGKADPKKLDAAFTGYWMMAVELWHLVQMRLAGTIDPAAYYPVGS